MAAFNPDLPQSQAQDFTYASRGVGTSNVFKTLFGGVASLGQDYLNARDEANKTAIYNQTVAGRDTAAAPYIGALGEAGYTGSPDGSGGPKGGPGAGSATLDPAPAPQQGIGNAPGQQGPYGRWAAGGANAVLSPKQPGQSAPVTDNTPANVDPTTTGSIPNGPVPQAITQGQDQMTSLTKALDAGTISKPYYDLQILNLSKDLHTRFPGYGQQIDATIQNVTGMDPTNQLVSDAVTISNANASSQKTADSEWNSFITAQGNQDAVASLYPDVYQNPKYKDPTARAQVQAGVAQFNAKIASLDVESKVNSLKQQQGTLDAHTVAQSGLSFASTVDNQAFAAADSIGGLSKRLDVIAQDPTKASGGEVTQMIATAGAVRAHEQDAVNGWLDRGIHVNPDGTYSGQTNREFIMSEPGGDAIITGIQKAASAHTDIIIDRLTNHDYGAANWFALNVKVGNEAGANKAWSESNGLKMAGIAHTLDPSGKLEERMAAPGSKYANDIQASGGAVADAAASTGYSGNPKDPTPSASKTTDDLLNNSGMSKENIAGTLRTHLDNSFTKLTTSKDPKEVANEVHYLFRDNNGFIESYIPKEQQASQFQRYTSKAVTDAITKTGDKELMGDYQKWAGDTATNVLGTNFADLSDFVAHIPNAQVSFDPKTFSVQYSASISAQPWDLVGHLDYANQSAYGSRAQGAVAGINAVLQNIKGIAESEGADPMVVADGLIKNVQAAGGTDKQGSVLGQIGDYLNNFVQSGDAAALGGDIGTGGSGPSKSDTQWNGLGDQASNTRPSKSGQIDMRTTGSIQPAAFHPGISDEYRPAGTQAAPTIPEDQKTLAAQPASQGVSDLTVSSVKDWEESGKAKLTAYNDGFGTPTIGYGHTGADVKPGTQITQEQADEYLKQDLHKSATAVENMVKVPLTEGQKTALTSFAFNEGEGALAKSTLLKKLNAGDYDGAAQAFNQWVYAKKDGHLVYVPGLQNRRDKEIAMFTGGTQTALNLQGRPQSKNIEDRRNLPPENNGQLRLDPNVEPTKPQGGLVKPQTTPPQPTPPPKEPSFMTGTERVNQLSPRNGVTQVDDKVPAQKDLQAQYDFLNNQIEKIAKAGGHAPDAWIRNRANAAQQLKSVYKVDVNKVRL